jgi:hypothetical protein
VSLEVLRDGHQELQQGELHSGRVEACGETLLRVRCFVPHAGGYAVQSIAAQTVLIEPEAIPPAALRNFILCVFLLSVFTPV